MKSPATQKLRVFKVCVLEKRASLPSGWTACVIDQHITFKPSVLGSYCFAPWQPIIFDLLLVAAAVNFCDWSHKRSASAWPRIFEVRVPVHEPSLWNDPAVRDALHEALRYLTGDTWSFAFVARDRPFDPVPEQPLPMPANNQAVIAFSKGLDSRSVAGWYDAEHGRDAIIRVRVGKGDRRQPTDRPFTALPFKIAPVGDSHETSSRARGFKFAAVSGLAAYLSNVSEIIVPESGSGALGPFLVRYGRMYSDYRNHPRFFRLMESFLSAVLKKQLTFKQPRLWCTKGESLLQYLEHPKVDRAFSQLDLLDTRSCWQDRHFVGDGVRKRQCGVCASCMLRRLSMHTAGIEEPRETYSWEDLNVSNLVDGALARHKDRIGPSLRNYAVAGTLHLKQLARLRGQYDYGASVAQQAREMAAAMGEEQQMVVKALDEFLQRHEEQWRSYLATLDAGSFVRKWAGLP